MPDTFDLVVLGTGAAGSTPTTKCRAAGWSVAVVDDQPYGGTCANRGCDPKKVLVGAEDVVAWHQRMIGHGAAGSASIDWPALMRFKRTFTDPVPRNRESEFEKAGIEMLRGAARFVADDRLVVGERELTAKHIVIATGASPRVLGIPGEEHIISSTDFLDLTALPHRIAFVGAGYVSLEFAHLARHAGSEVVVLGRNSPLPGFDHALVDTLIAHSREIGIDIRLGSDVTAVERNSTGTGFLVRSGTGSSSTVTEADLVVHGAGRVPNTAHLNVGAANVRVDSHHAVVVNEFLQSSTNPRVYAAGDVALPTNSLPLTPVAGHEGSVVASNLLAGNTKRPDYRGIASVVFTSPPLAGVGLTEQAARDQGIDIHVECGDTTTWYSNRRVRQPVGMYKTIVATETDKVIGAHLLGTNAEEVINLFALAIRFGLSATDLRGMIYAYPTSGSDVKYML